MRIYVILTVLFLSLIIGTGCSDSIPISTYTDIRERPEYLDRFADKIAQGYAVFDANGNGLYNVNSVIDFFSGTPQAPTFIGIITYGQGGEPAVHEITYVNKQYKLYVKIETRWTGVEEINLLFDHAAFIDGAVQGQGCVLYNGEKPSVYKLEEWSDGQAFLICNILP